MIKWIKRRYEPGWLFQRIGDDSPITRRDDPRYKRIVLAKTVKREMREVLPEIAACALWTIAVPVVMVVTAMFLMLIQ